jgi:hypothetical protein
MNFESLEDFFTRSASDKQNSNTTSTQNVDLTSTEERMFGITNKSINDSLKISSDSDVNNAEVSVSKPAVSIQATPSTPSIPAAISIKSAVKTAPIDTILFNDDSVSIDRMVNLILEDIGGHELINIARNDIINGQTISYQPIKNLSSIQQQYNPNNILGIQNTSDKYFSNFSIKFENKIPSYDNDSNRSNVYLENLTGNLVIETVNMESDEQIEVEITVSATIYEAEFGDNIS